MALDKDAWVKRALELKPESRMYINGAYVDSASGKTFDDISPRDQRLIAKIAAGDTEDVNRAVAAAKAAFDSGVWREMNPRDKKAIMLKWADLIREHQEELAQACFEYRWPRVNHRGLTWSVYLRYGLWCFKDL